MRSDWPRYVGKCGQSYKHFTLVNYDSRVVFYERSGFIKLATDHAFNCKCFHHSSSRMLKIVQRNRLVRKIREQNDLLLSLQEQLDTYMFRSFPSLGWPWTSLQSKHLPCWICKPAANVVNNFLNRVLCWNEVLWLDVPSHMTIFNHWKCVISRIVDLKL